MASLGFSPRLLSDCGALPDGDRIRFPYHNPELGQTYFRVYHLTRWQANGNYKLWEPGARAAGSMWVAKQPDPFARIVLVCEGETDALAAVHHGCPWGVVSLPGAQMMTPYLAGYLSGWAQQLIFAFDNDNAGRHGLEKWSRLLDTDLRIADLEQDTDLRYHLATGEIPPWNGNITGFPKPPDPEVPAQSLNFTFSPRTELRAPRDENHDPKPDLRATWDRLVPRRQRIRRDGRNRSVASAYCPLHDDKNHPSAWVGTHRWGCFACGIDAADVYELIAWTQGIEQPGVKLTGDSFRRAKEYARSIA